MQPVSAPLSILAAWLRPVKPCHGLQRAQQPVQQRLPVWPYLNRHTDGSCVRGLRRHSRSNAYANRMHARMHSHTAEPVQSRAAARRQVIGDYMMDMRDITSNYSKREAQQQKKK